MDETRRTFRYYAYWAGQTFNPSFNFADRLAGSVGVLVPFIIWLIKVRTHNLSTELESALTVLQWQIPAIAFGLLFIFRLFWASYRLFRTVSDQRDSLIVKEDAVTEALANGYFEGATIHVRKVTNEAELNQWKEDAKTWRTKTSLYIRTHIGKTDALLFAFTRYTITVVEGEFNMEHRKELAHLGAMLSDLKVIIERRRGKVGDMALTKP